MPAPENRFWMICREPTGRSSKTQPTARYGHRDAAFDDAARLARDTGANYLILETVEVVTPAARLTQGRLF